MVRKSLPLAQQVVQEILSGLEAGNLVHDNGVLPSEVELSLKFNVSRATIRDALTRLEQRGVVYRRHGVGTFVAPQPPVLESGFEQLESMHTLAHRIGLDIHMHEADVAERAAKPNEAERLGIAPGAPVLSVARVMLTGTQPVAYLIDILPSQVLQPQDLDETFNGSVLDLLTQRTDLALSHSNTTISMATADAIIARKLHLQKGEMVQKLDATLYGRDERIIAFSLSYLAPGYFRFHVVRRIHPCES